MEEKKTGDNRLTIILGVILGALILAVVIPVFFGDVIGRDDGLTMTVTDAPPKSKSAEATPSKVSRPSATAPISSRGAAAEKIEINTFCRSYVFSRCNRLLIPGRECTPIASRAGSVPRKLGMVGCRGAVDDLIAAAAEKVTPEEAAMVGRKIPEAELKGDASRKAQTGDREDGSVIPVRRRKFSTRVPSDASGAAARGPRVVISTKPKKDNVEKGMERIRQLEKEIQIQRNTYVGTNIGIHSRLNEAKKIAETLETEDARAAYNGMLKRVGRGGDAPEPGSEAGSVSTTAAEVKPSSL